MKVRFILEGYEQSGPDTYVTSYATVDADVPELDGRVYVRPGIGGPNYLIKGVEILPPPEGKDQT